jgi:hypothetical protein
LKLFPDSARPFIDEAAAFPLVFVGVGQLRRSLQPAYHLAKQKPADTKTLKAKYGINYRNTDFSGEVREAYELSVREYDGR